MTEHVLTVRRLPSLPDHAPTMRFERDGEVLWEAPLDRRIEVLLAGRWSCQLLAREDKGEMEILGEAPSAPEDATPKKKSPQGPWKPKLAD